MSIQEGREIRVGEKVSLEDSGPDPNSFLGSCLWGVSHPPLKSTFNEHPLARTTVLHGAPISLNPQSGKLVAVPGCRGKGIKRVRSRQFLLQFLSITIQGYSWDCQLVIFIYNLKNRNAFRCCKSMSHSPPPLSIALRKMSSHGPMTPLYCHKPGVAVMDKWSFMCLLSERIV